MIFFFKIDIGHKMVTNRLENCDGIVFPSQICGGFKIPSQICDGFRVPSQNSDENDFPSLCFDGNVIC